MSNCSNHKKELYGQTDMRHLAEDIGSLHYESLTQLLYWLSKKIEDDSVKDNNAGRKKLAAALQYVGFSIFESSLRMGKVWEVCKPHMLNSVQEVQESDTTGSDSSNADHQIKISELREKFFDECVKEIDVMISDDDIETHQTIWKEPEEIFEWFKPYLKIPSIDWEGLEEAIKQAPDWFKHVQGEYYEDNQSVFDWLKTKLQDYIK